MINSSFYSIEFFKLSIKKNLLLQTINLNPPLNGGITNHIEQGLTSCKPVVSAGGRGGRNFDLFKGWLVVRFSLVSYACLFNKSKSSNSSPTNLKGKPQPTAYIFLGFTKYIVLI